MRLQLATRFKAAIFRELRAWSLRGHMRRRDFIALFGSAAAAGFPALSAHGQQPARLRRIAIAIPGPYWREDAKANPYQGAFFDELARVDFVEGRNLVVNRYSTEGQGTFPYLARSVAMSQPELIFTATTPMTFALQAAEHEPFQSLRLSAIR